MQNPALWLAALALLVFLLTRWIAQEVFLSYPATMDEYNFYYQAHIFARGERFLQVPEAAWPLFEHYMLYHDGRLFTKYHPGFPAVLSIFVRLGIPDIANPLLSALTLCILCLTVRHAVGWPAAFCTALIFATNIYFLGYGSSFYAHPLSLLLGSIQLYCARAWLTSHRSMWLLLGGVTGGAACWVRPVDALVITAAFASCILKKNMRVTLRHIALLTGPAFLLCMGLFGYNWLLTGCFCMANYETITTFEFFIYDTSAPDWLSGMQRVFDVYAYGMRHYMSALFIYHWLPYVGIGLAGLSMLGLYHERSRTGIFCLTYIALTVLLYNFHVSPGYPIYGARYWYLFIAPLFILVARGCAFLGSKLTPAAASLLLAGLIGCQIFQLHEDTAVYANRAQVRQQLQTDIYEQCPEGSLVSIVRKNLHGWPYYIFLDDVKRNPFQQGYHLYVYQGDATDELRALLPDYTDCTYNLDQDAFPLPTLPRSTFNWDLKNG